MEPPDQSECVFIVAPFGRDAPAMAALLRENGLRALVCHGAREARARLDDGAGALILTDEALVREHVPELFERLAAQPAWSELPIVVLTSGRTEAGFERLLAWLTQAAGSITVLERPIHTATFLRSVQVALRSRRRQYQVRDLLEEQRRRQAELREALEAQERSAAQLQQSDRRKNEFLATLAHELRNPLAPIGQAAQILTSPRLSPQQLKWSREIIQRQVVHMTRLLEDLLDVARVTYGKLNLQRSNVLLSTVIEAAVETAQPLIGAKRHELTVSVPESALELDGDAVRLTQIFGNLLTNAAKYTEPGGRIALTAARDGARVKVTVRDSGIGIAPEVLPRIFEMFAQGSGSRNQAQGGLGIGLALTKALVELHGGTISASSEAGRGTEFTVSLPVAERVDAAPPLRPAGTEPAASRRVLIVDDNRDAADTLAVLLRAEGHTVAVAYGGEQALASAAAFQPDIALLDLGMPNMDGYELARRLRGQPWGKAVRLVAVTGWGQQADRQRTVAAGFQSHLVKPASIEDLHAVIAAPSRAAAEAAGGPAH